VDRFAPGTGSDVSALLGAPIERVVERAGPGLEALLLAGSHATGEAVWVEREGRAVTLSDLDLYAVMRDEPSAAAARARAAASPLASPLERRAWGLSAPIEVAWVTLAGLARMPARPATVELSRSARVVAGDAGLQARLPRWEPGAISAEERLLLLENRAFELLWARLSHQRELPQAQHAVLKTALDLAAVRTLAVGELPRAAAARAARARELGSPPGTPAWLEGAWARLPAVWEEAVAWRAPGTRAARDVSEAVHAGAWRTVVRAWCVAWWAEALAAGRPGGPASESREPREPWASACALAARGSLARRVRRSLAFAARQGETPGLGERLRRARRGTPALRIHGSATVLLLAAAQSPRSPQSSEAPGAAAPGALPAGALHALRRLGITAADSFTRAALDVVRAWDRQLQSGERTEELG